MPGMMLKITPQNQSGTDPMAMVELTQPAPMGTGAGLQDAPGTFLVVWWLRICLFRGFHAGNMGSIPVPRTKIPHALGELGFPGGSEVKASAWYSGDLGLIPGSGRSPGKGNGNPLQYSCLENPIEGGAWWATVHGVAKSRTRLNDFTFFTWAN